MRSRNPVLRGTKTAGRKVKMVPNFTCKLNQERGQIEEVLGTENVREYLVTKDKAERS